MNRVLFSFFSPSYSSVTLGYAETERALDEAEPGHNFAFLGSPFKCMVHPLLRSGRVERKRMLVQLRRCWNELAAACDTLVLPEFSRGRNVVLDGCGLDAAFGLWLKSPPDLREEIVARHFEYVRTHLKARGLPAPTYFLVRGTPDSEYAAFMALHPHAAVMPSQYAEYLAQFETFRMQYFGHASQLPPIGFNCAVLTADSIGQHVANRLLDRRMLQAA